MLSLVLGGLIEALQALGLLREGVAEAGRTAITVGTPVVYAYGQHEGRYRSGRLARRAGPTYFLSGPLQEMAPGIKTTYLAALPGGSTAVGMALRALAHQLEARARERAPVKSGRLRESIHSLVEGR